jgi:hypothetical protein
VSVEVRLDRAALLRLAHDESLGPARAAERVARQVRDAAKRRAPVQSQRLQRSIRVLDPRPGPRGLVFDVVAPVPYAQWIMRGRRRDPRVRGGVVYARAGARPFLVDALWEVWM